MESYSMFSFGLTFMHVYGCEILLMCSKSWFVLIAL